MLSITEVLKYLRPSARPPALTYMMYSGLKKEDKLINDEFYPENFYTKEEIVCNVLCSSFIFNHTLEGPDIWRAYPIYPEDQWKKVASNLSFFVSSNSSKRIGKIILALQITLVSVTLPKELK